MSRKNLTREILACQAIGMQVPLTMVMWLPEREAFGAKRDE